MNKNVLCIIYFFPPIGGSGVQRALKFVKYMPEFGITPVVETVESGHNFAYDESLLNEIPQCAKVYRSNSGETLWLRNAIEKVSSLKNRRSANKAEDTAKDSAPSAPAKPGLKERVFNFIDLNFFIPDSKIRWYKNAVKDIDKVLNTEKIDYIFSTSYPYTVHLIALEAKKKTNLPWVADFRDPWVGNVLMTKGHSDKRKEKEKKMEYEVVKYADKIIMVTEPICNTYKERYPEFKDKFVTITNGFDSEDFVKIEKITEEKFTICYAGILTDGRSPETLIHAVESFIDNNPDAKNRIKLKLIGFIIDEYKQLISDSKIRDNFEILSYMPHSECLRHMKGADINLLVLPDKKESKGDFTGKIFDYIGVEKPVLGIMPDNGVASNLIINKGMGESFNHGDIDGVYGFIEKYYKLWENGTAVQTGSIERCQEYNRKYLTGRLVDLFK